MALPKTSMTRAQTLAKVETWIAFYQNDMDKADRVHPNDMSYRIALSNRERVKHDLAYLKRGTNWRLVHTHYPYTVYDRYSVTV
jgi:hypothetical protein